MKDTFGRTIDYLRLAITDRCNLRCHYCMPASGLPWLQRDELLSFEEIERLLTVFASLGVRKLRFTGGEPFMRKDFDQLLIRVAESKLFESITITTNGVLTAPFIPLLKQLNIDSVNLSLDTLDEQRFATITRRDVFRDVMKTFEALLHHGIRTKMNAVIMEDVNEADLLPLALLSKDLPVDVRFIEEMPFNGRGNRHAVKWNRVGLHEALTEGLGTLEQLPAPPHSTSEIFKATGHQGTIGIIAAWSRTFCGTCNRIRLTPSGQMKTCLYGNNALDLRTLMRNDASNDTLAKSIEMAILHKSKDGFEAQNQRTPVSESMATIGG
ncbi:MAG: GTP 3',8-cyclase MoaA [Flavobacteriales bacterium]